MGEYKFNCHLDRDHESRLRCLAETGNWTMTETVRRLLDHCSQERVWNEMMPTLSGRLSNGMK